MSGNEQGSMGQKRPGGYNNRGVNQGNRNMEERKKERVVTEENYVDMCQRVRNLESDDSVTGGSNFGKFIKLFESDDSRWIEEINRKLEE